MDNRTAWPTRFKRFQSTRAVEFLSRAGALMPRGGGPTAGALAGLPASTLEGLTTSMTIARGPGHSTAAGTSTEPVGSTSNRASRVECPRRCHVAVLIQTEDKNVGSNAMDYTHWVALVVFVHTDVPSGFHETFALFFGHDTALVHVTLLSTLGHQFSSTAMRRIPAS